MNKNIKYILFGICLLGLAGCKARTTFPVIIESKVDKNKITIGDRVNYDITIKYKSDLQVQLPDFTTELGQFEIKDYKISNPKSWGNRKTVKHHYLITTFTTGEYKTPELVVEYTDKSGEKKQVKSAPISIFVEAIKPKPGEVDDVRDVKPPVTIPHGWLFYLLLFLIPFLLIAGGIGYYYYQTRKSEDIFSQSGPARPADEVAYERLDKLRNLDLISQGRIKEYYIILSEIIRQYLESRYLIPVLDRTTLELYHEMREAKWDDGQPKIDKKHCMTIKEFLEECDLVKFAKYTPESDIINKDTGQAKNIIDITKIS